MDVLYVSYGRAFLEIGLAFPGRAAEPIGSELGEVGGVPEVLPIGDGALRNGRFETIRMADHPIGEYAAAAAAGNRQLVGIHPAALDQVVHTSHQILVVVARVVVLDDI